MGIPGMDVSKFRMPNEQCIFGTLRQPHEPHVRQPPLSGGLQLRVQRLALGGFEVDSTGVQPH